MSGSAFWPIPKQYQMTHCTQFKLALSTFFVLSLSGCLNPAPKATPNPQSSLSEQERTSPEYQLASDFDRFCKKTMSEEQQAEILASCRADVNANPFCFSYLKSHALFKKKQQREHIAQPPIVSKPEPVTPTLKKGKIVKWNKIRRVRVSSLLAGLADANVETLQALGKFALKAKGCPNNVAIATAAMLESFLAESPVAGPIARLYEKGGDCARRNSADREHFYTRSALFDILQKNYGKAERLLARVRPTDAFSGRTLYWLARVRSQMGNAKGAAAAYRRLHNTHPFSFHTLVSLASQNIDALAEYEDNHPIPMTRAKRNKSLNTLIEQAELLNKFNFRDSAELVVDWALDNYHPTESGVRLYLAELGSPRSKCQVMGEVLLRRRNLRSRKSLELAYPKAYFEMFEKQKGSVDPFFMMAIARKESTLDPKAVSPANAQGLLQVHPDTAKRLSNKTNINLLDPEVNAELSAKYLRILLDMMKNQLPLVLASYNAGEEPVVRWLHRYPTTDPLLFIDLIPYRETRDYVGFVMANYFWYRRLYSDGQSNPLTFLTTTELAKIDDSKRGVQSTKDDVVSDDPLEVEENFELSTDPVEESDEPEGPAPASE